MELRDRVQPTKGSFFATSISRLNRITRGTCLQRRVFVFYSISLNESRGSDAASLVPICFSARLIKRYGTEGSRQVRRVRGSEAGRVNAAKRGWCR